MLIGNVQASCYSLSYLPRPEDPLFLTLLMSSEDSSNEASVYFSHRHQKPFVLNYLIVSGLLEFFLHRTSDLEKVCRTCLAVKMYHCHRMHHLTLCHSQVTCCATSVLAQMAFHCWPLSNLGPLCHPLRMNGPTMTMWSFHLISDADTAKVTLHFHLIPSECFTCLMSIYKPNFFKSTM